jgi:hypothetical protein
MKQPPPGYYCPHCEEQAALRGPPENEERFPGHEEAQNSNVTKQAEPKAVPAGFQPLPMTNEEIRTLALSLYPEAFDDRDHGGRKVIDDLRLLALVNPDVVVECAYYTGAWHALMKTRVLTAPGNN